MNFKKYVTEYLPKKCGVHPSFGEVAWLIFCEEQNGNQAFAADKFKNARERAKLGMPYKPVNILEYNKGLDVLELAILNSYQKKKNENHQKRISELHESRNFDMIEIDVLAADWWSG